MARSLVPLLHNRWSPVRQPQTRTSPRRIGLSSAIHVVSACVRALSLFGLILGLFASAAVAQAALPKRVDLRPSQTPIRDQKGRRTCIVHSVAAAMEAALKRSGHNVDLSEDTFMYFVKQFWLSSIDGKPAGTCENQVGGCDGGGGVENLAFLAGGLAIPEESTGHPDGYNYQVPPSGPNNRWNSQFNVDSWNLSPRRLLPSTLGARRYFTITGYKALANAKDTREIEEALNQGHEVVWDFKVCGKRPRNGVWQYDGPSKRGSDQHSMLIVGYDRRDPKTPYFIIKNSWGPTKTPGANGFTYFSYAFLQYGVSGGYLTGVRQVSRPSLRFLGRWEVTFDGWKGILDVSHIPGAFRGVLALNKDHRIDRRIGTFYDKNNPNMPLRVNGSIRGNRIDFYVDWSTPNPGLTKCAGRHFTYYLSEGDDRLIVGTHRDPDGTVYGGFARRLESDGAFPSEAQVIDAAHLSEMEPYVPSARIGTEPAPESYLGEWTLYCRSEPMAVHLRQRDDSVVPRDRQEAFAGFTGDGVVALVDKRDPRNFQLVVFAPESDRVEMSVHGRLLTRESGTIAGTAQLTGRPQNARFGAILVRGSLTETDNSPALSRFEPHSRASDSPHS